MLARKKSTCFVIILFLISSCVSFSGIRLDDPDERAAIIRDINLGGRFNYHINPDDLPGLSELLISENEIERYAGLVLVNQYQGEEKVPLILRLYYDESERIQERIKQGLEEDTELFLGYIRENLLDVTPNVQVVFLKILRVYGDKGDVSLISQLFEQDEDQIVLSAALTIVSLVDPSVFINSGALEDGSENVRKNAYLVLEKFNDPDLIPIIVKGLSDKSRAVRNEAAFSLNQFGDSILPFLYPLLENGSFNEIESALYLLIPLHNEESLPYVISLISDESETVKEQSLAFIRSFGETAIPYLREKAKNGSRRDRFEAVKLLVELNDFHSSGIFLDFLLLNDEALKMVIEQALIDWDEKIFSYLYQNMEETDSRARQSVLWLRNLGDPMLCYDEEGALNIRRSLYLLQFSSESELESYFEEVSFNVRTADDFRRYYELLSLIPRFQRIKQSMIRKDNNLYLYYFRLYEEALVKSQESMEKSFRLTQAYFDSGKNEYLDQSQEARDAGIRFKEDADYLDRLLQEMKSSPDGGEMLSREYARLRKNITDSWYLAREENRTLAKAVYRSYGLDIDVLLNEEMRISP